MLWKYTIHECLLHYIYYCANLVAIVIVFIPEIKCKIL